jgi:hypothetical protein
LNYDSLLFTNSPNRPVLHVKDMTNRTMFAMIMTPKRIKMFIKD